MNYIWMDVIVILNLVMLSDKLCSKFVFVLKLCSETAKGLNRLPAVRFPCQPFIFSLPAADHFFPCQPFVFFPASRSFFLLARSSFYMQFCRYRQVLAPRSDNRFRAYTFYSGPGSRIDTSLELAVGGLVLVVGGLVCGPERRREGAETERSCFSLGVK
jgi:hypothetical protein